MFVDEADLYKNLAYTTKMNRIAGLPNSDSNRAFDMFLKIRYLQERNDGRGVVFATGTPISNTLAEMYTMLRYLAPEMLSERSVNHFDPWAANFAEAVTSLELAPDGSGYRMHTRFAKFINLPELLTMFRTVADVQTADMLNLPRPALENDRPAIEAAAASPELKAFIRTLTERAERLKKERVDPAVDNMLKITGEGRKAALDMRLVQPGVEPAEETKIDRAVSRIVKIWKATQNERSAQLVFSDLSTPDPERFNVYNDIRSKLVAAGIPRSDIAFIHDAETDTAKKVLFDGVNAGRVRILLARHHDVVVVTHNHRLNVFGFLNLAGIGGERFANSGNVGMLDNVAVLEWVRDNIANFGGDPGNVMIYGQSGGGGKVSHLMAMPGAKGLFHRAAIESGATLRSGSTDDAAKVADALLKELNIPSGQFEKLQTVSAAALVTAQAAALRSLSGTGGRASWGPIVDGKVIPAHPFHPDAPAVSANVPMLIGTCLNEFVNGVDNPEVDSLTNEELLKRVTQRHGDNAPGIIAAYRREYPKESAFGIWAAISASAPRQNAATQAERKAAQGGAPAYQYIYAWRTPVLDDRPGTFHSSEIAFVFDNADLCTRYSGGGPDALRLSSAIAEAWASFARTGKPGHRGLPDWPAYTAEKRATMIFNTTCAVKNDPEGECLRLVRQGQRGA